MLVVSPSSVSERIKTFHAFLPPEKVHLKYSLMAENAYRFFRGTCHLFYEDLKGHTDFPHTAPPVWGSGDLHLENFGSYKAANGYVYFDQNDFDESMLLPATWELARVVASIIVAFRSLAVAEEKIRGWTKLFVQNYCKRLVSGKAKHVEARLAKGIVREFLEQADLRKEKALLRKLVGRNKKGELFLNSGDKRSALEKEIRNALLPFIEKWLPQSPGKMLRGHNVIDACNRTAGTGSVGVNRYILLLQNAVYENKFLLLDMKEARPSALRPYNPVPQPAWSSEAERVVAIQSRSQYATTAQLAAVNFEGASYTVQEMQPEEDKLDFTLVVRHDRDVLRVIKDMAMLTASAQLRSAGRQGSAIADDLIAFGNDVEWQEQLMKYAVAYAAKVAEDYPSFLSDYKKGFFNVAQ